MLTAHARELFAQRAVDAALAAQKCAIDEADAQSRRELAQTAAAARDELAAARKALDADREALASLARALAARCQDLEARLCSHCRPPPGPAPTSRLNECEMAVEKRCVKRRSPPPIVSSSSSLSRDELRRSCGGSLDPRS